MQYGEVNPPDEVDCPRCGGRGRIMPREPRCLYCDGARQMSEAERDNYSSEDFEEVTCPHCKGRGKAGPRKARCKLCRGARMVLRHVADRYEPPISLS
jgi:DnaJ-class molecular chaperone